MKHLYFESNHGKERGTLIGQIRLPAGRFIILAGRLSNIIHIHFICDEKMKNKAVILTTINTIM